MKKLDQTGFVFLGSDGLPYRCCMWGDEPWLFKWHNTGHWVSMKSVSQGDILMMPHNLTDEQQKLYNDKHDAWNNQLDQLYEGED